MDQYAFEEYLDSQPKVRGTQPVGRFVKNVFDQDERVVLPRCYWQYLDWVADFEDFDVAGWIKRCDEYRDEKTLSENLMEWLYWDMGERLRDGLYYPAFLPIPDGFEE